MSNFFLNHIVVNHHESYNGNNIIKHILQDGYLRPSIITKNMGFSGDDCEYIYFRLDYKKSRFIPTFKFDISLLLTQKFYINIPWNHSITKHTIQIDGRKLSYSQLIEVLNELQKNIKQWIKENKKLPELISHEIFIKNSVSLKKYLRFVYSSYIHDDEIVSLIHKKYKNVEIL